MQIPAITIDISITPPISKSTLGRTGQIFLETEKSRDSYTRIDNVDAVLRVHIRLSESLIRVGAGLQRGGFDQVSEQIRRLVVG